MADHDHTCGEAGGITKDDKPCGRPTKKGSRCSHHKGDATNAGQFDQYGDQVLSMYVGGLSYRDIEDRLPISRTTVATYLHRALKERRQQRHDLADQYIEQEVERLRQNIRQLDEALDNLRTSESWSDGDPTAVKAAKDVAAERRKQGESLRKLLGLDRPNKVDVTTDGKSLTADPLAGMTPEEKKQALRDRLAQLEASESAPRPEDLKGIPGDG